MGEEAVVGEVMGEETTTQRSGFWAKGKVKRKEKKKKKEKRKKKIQIFHHTCLFIRPRRGELGYYRVASVL